MGKKATYEKVKNDFDELGLELISSTFKRGKDTLEFMCKTHRCLGIQTMTYETAKTRLKEGKYGCRECRNEANNELRKIQSRYKVKKEQEVLSNEEYARRVYEINPHIKLLGKYRDGMKSITIQCTIDGYICRVPVAMLLKPFKCIICTKGKENIKFGVNDIASQNPVMAKMVHNKEDLNKYKINSRAKIDFDCPCCGALLKNKTIYQVHERGLKCKCMDGNSLGEKYFHEVLVQVIDGWDEEYYINGNYDYRYDFHGVLTNGKQWIVEIQGKQHSGKTFETCGGRSLEEEIENDRLKKDYALNNGIDYYICIDSRHAGFNEMKKEILKSDFAKLFDLNNIDWVLAYSNSLTSDVQKACDLWNSGLKVMQICEVLDRRKGTIRAYLTKGNEIGWCNYDHTNSTRTSIICLNTGKVYRSQRDAEREYGLKRGRICDLLRKNRDLVINGEAIRWMYYEDYLKLNKNKDLEECVG